MRKTLVFIITTLILTTTLAAQGWGPDVRLTNDPAESYTSYNNAWCVAASGDNVYVVWYDGRDGNYEIYYKRSTDGGLDWGPDIRLSNGSGDSYAASIAVWNDNVHVVWHDTRDGNREIYYKQSLDNGETWSDDIRLTTDLAYSWRPSIAVEGECVHVVWQDERSGNSDIYYKVSTDNGNTWSDDERLTYTSTVSQYATVAVSGSNIHVAWTDNLPSHGTIWYVRSIDNGNSWGSGLQLSEYNECYYPSIAAEGEIVHLGWNDGRPGLGSYEVFYKRSIDNGSNWGPDKRLTFCSGSSGQPSLAVSGSNVRMVWRDNRDGNREVYYKESPDNGHSWETDTRLTNNSSNKDFISVANSGDKIHVIWNDNRGGNWEIYYKRYFPQPNIAPLAAATGTSLHPGGGRDVDKLNDESFSGFWESAYTTGQPGDVWMMYEWPRPYRLDASIFYCSPATPPHLNLPILYNVEAWVNGAWQEIAYVVNTDSNKAIFGNGLQDVVTTKLRVNLIDVRDTDSWGRDVATLSEWQVFGDTAIGPQVITATVDFDPDKLNFASKGKWVTCYIELPAPHSAEDIDLSTVAIVQVGEEILDPALFREGPTEIGDHDSDGVTDLMVKFDRQALIAILQSLGYEDGDEVELTVAGELITGENFAGSDVINSLDKGKDDENDDGDNDEGDPDEETLFSSGGGTPNPFTVSTTLTYRLNRESEIQITVYDALGRRVRTLINRSQTPGDYTIIWDGRDDACVRLPQGVYLISLEVDGNAEALTRVILK